MKKIQKEIINTTKQIEELVDWLVSRHAQEQYEPTMYIDLEDVNLCREGSVSILTLLIDAGISTIRVCLVDVDSLSLRAFNTTGIKSKTFKDILQDEKNSKVFFDVRNDSDALFAHYGVALQVVRDVQLMESATRETTRSRKHMNGLAKCIESYARMNVRDTKSWNVAKEKGEQLFKRERGVSYKIFNQRPIPEDIILYCVGDVQYVPTLHAIFWSQTNRWRDLVDDETKRRVSSTQKPEYLPHAGPNRALAPWSEEQNRTLNGWNHVPYPTYNHWDNDDNEWYNEDHNDFEDFTLLVWQLGGPRPWLSQISSSQVSTFTGQLTITWNLK